MYFQTRKKIELCQDDSIFTKIFELYLVSNWLDMHKDFNCQNVSRPSNQLYFFYSSSNMQKSHHLLGCHATGITSSLIFSLSALRWRE